MNHAEFDTAFAHADPVTESKQLCFADVIAEVSKLAADPLETSLVIDHMLQHASIRFADDFDMRRLAI